MSAPERSVSTSNVAARVAQAWSIYLMLMGIYWAAGGAGYPFGNGDPKGFESGSILAGMDASIGGPAIALAGLVGLGLTLLLERADPRTSGQSKALAVAGAAYACVLVAVGVDSRALMLLPPLGLAPLKWVEADWPTVFQMTIPVAATGFVLATVTMARRTADRSAAGLVRAAASSRAWDRAGRIATYVAMICPLPYAIIRLCWSRGWAVGAPEPFVEHILRTQPENVWIEPILASFALTGVLLTSGLLARWGRRFPSWSPVLGGRRVPLWLPLGLGGSAAVGIWSFGRGMLLGRLGVDFPRRLGEFQQWGVSTSGWEYWGADGLAWVLFPLWAISLAVALVGYYHRRRLHDDSVDPSAPAAVGEPQRSAGNAVASAVIACVLVAMSALVLPSHEVASWRGSFSPQLLTPSGAEAVGLRRTILETGADDPWVPRQRRALMIDIRYPATAGKHPLRHYLRAQHMSELAMLTWAPSHEHRLGLYEHEVNWQFITHSYEWAPARQGTFPAVVIAAPEGGMRTSLTALAEDLVSHGFVVVTVDHPYRTPIVELWPTREVVQAGDAERELTDQAAANAQADDLSAVKDRINDLDDEIADVLTSECVLVLPDDLQNHVTTLRDDPMIEAQIAARYPRAAATIGPIPSMLQAERDFRANSAEFRDTVTSLLAQQAPGCGS